MRYIDNEDGHHVVELTRRNLEVLLAELDDPLSMRTLIDGDDKIMVRAVETDAYRGDIPAQTAAAREGTIEVTRSELKTLLAGLDAPSELATSVFIGDHAIMVRAMENDAHYRGRAPGPM
ncbi:MAG TPA: hypothetical protein VEF72_31180 [Mycobacterium sp.]|nr:hypothetical protein [Mycobacterium sp.]